MISEARHQRRIMLMLRALLAICGESLRKCFMSQQLLVKVSFCVMGINGEPLDVKKRKISKEIISG